MLFGVLVLLAGCGGSGGGSGAGSGGDEAAPRAPAASAAPAASPTASAGALGPTDLAWVNLMIPLNDQLLPLLDEAAERGDDPALRTLAEDLSATLGAELDALHALLDEAGVAYRNLHEGHDMPGMVTRRELDEVAGLAGPAFDRRALAHLREYVEQSATVSRGERDAGTHRDATSLATAFVEARTALLDDVTGLTGTG
ncbi:DUF305 domain-containing protein [Streptomyces sp. 4N509B]|uniref:DUF305 domain-containing protein n=1 Tax=Streptomyces sp. 4N509B TaxID=3457413 RepID=UPI003FD05FD1